MKTLLVMLLGLAVLAVSVPASAHFQMIYTPESALDKAKSIDIELVFTHPFEAGHTMDMGHAGTILCGPQGKENGSHGQFGTDHLEESDQQRQGL